VNEQMVKSARRTLISSLILLAALAALVAWILTIPPESEPEALCGRFSAVPVMPLGVDYPRFRLEAFGRSAFYIARGETLCLALKWETGPVPPVDHTIFIELVGRGDSIAGRYAYPLTSPAGWQPFSEPVEYYSLRINPHALPGRYNIQVTIRADGGALRAPITIGIVQVIKKPIYTEEDR
jgi:hypothetical protein